MFWVAGGLHRLTGNISDVMDETGLSNYAQDILVAWVD